MMIGRTKRKNMIRIRTQKRIKRTKRKLRKM